MPLEDHESKLVSSKHILTGSEYKDNQTDGEGTPLPDTTAIHQQSVIEPEEEDTLKLQSRARSKG